MGEGEGGTLVHKYRILGKAGEGTFSEVLKAVHIHSKKYVAIKRMKQKFHSVQQVNSLREVQALRRLNPHSHIIGLKEIIFDRRIGSLSLVCELFDQNLYEVIRARTRPMEENRVASLITQLLTALDHTHRAGIYHRDIKPENILVSNEHLKLADFGSCRALHSKHPLTEYISTRWYRPPECLLTEGRYGYKMDLWATGCVMYELTCLRPLFPGSNELDQVHRIHAILGSPSEKVLNKFFQFRNRQIPWDFPETTGSGIERAIGSLLSRAGISVLYKLIKYDPEERITARQALRSEWCKIALKSSKARDSGRKGAAREGSRDSGVDMDSPSIASNYETKKKKETRKKTQNVEKVETNFVKPLSNADQLADMKSSSKSSIIPKFKFSKAQKLDLRRTIQEKNQSSLTQKLPSINHKPKQSKLSQLPAFGSKSTKLPVIAGKNQVTLSGKSVPQELGIKKYPSPKVVRKRDSNNNSPKIESPIPQSFNSSSGSINGKRKRKKSISKKKKKVV